MPERRESVNDRYFRVPSKGLKRYEDEFTWVQNEKRSVYRDLGVVANTRENALGHTADDPRRVAHALIDTKLDIFLAQKEGTSSKEVRGCLGADPRPRATFGKEESDSLVSE